MITNTDFIPNLISIESRIARIDEGHKDEVKRFKDSIDSRIQTIIDNSEKAKAKVPAVRQALLNIDKCPVKVSVTCEWGTGALIRILDIEGRKDRKGLRPIDYAIVELRRAIGTKEFTESKYLCTKKDDERYGQIDVTLTPKEPELAGVQVSYWMPKPPKGGKCKVVTMKKLVCEVS